jgi:chemotaxis protein methyltransferase CheR
MLELGIVETRNIMKTILEKYNYDFSDYSLTSFKRRLENIIEQQNLKYADSLILKLRDNAVYFEQFLDEVATPSTEMFRDPSLWRIFRDELLPSLIHETNGNLKVWLPNSVSGDELFSLVITLHELNLLDKVQIFVSSLSSKSLENIRSGYMSSSKLELSADNYIRANGTDDFSKYYHTQGSIILRDVSLINNVIFSTQNLNLEPPANGIKLVLFRNKMIYYNQTYQSKILRQLFTFLPPGAYLIIGTKESLNSFYGNSEFSLVNNSESIYKRKP